MYIGKTTHRWVAWLLACGLFFSVVSPTENTGMRKEMVNIWIKIKIQENIQDIPKSQSLLDGPTAFAPNSVACQLNGCDTGWCSQTVIIVILTSHFVNIYLKSNQFTQIYFWPISPPPSLNPLHFIWSRNSKWLPIRNCIAGKILDVSYKSHKPTLEPITLCEVAGGRGGREQQ